MKALKVIFGNLHSRIWAIVTACFLVLAIVANIVIFNVVNKVFDNLWGGDSSSGRGEGGAFTLDEGITDKASALENTNAVNEEICEEGYVLLKNEGVLPMKTSKDAPKKISVFGKNSVNLVYSGSGSGGGKADDARTIYESLEAAGYEYNPTLKSFYENDSQSGTGRPETATIGTGGVIAGFKVGETPVANYDAAGVKSSFAGYSDMALVVISRTCGEGADAPVQVIWQTGKYYEREMQAFLAAHPVANIWQGAFIDRMDYAYAAADLVLSRSGAGTVSELCLVAKPVLFVPSPNVAEDHQTKNAKALEAKGAAVVVPDAEARTAAMRRAMELLSDKEALRTMSENLEKLARPDAAERIVDEIEKVMK